MSKWQVVWDNSIIDNGSTDAYFIVEKPVKKEAVFVCDRPWELNRIYYANGFWDEDIKKYRLYYLAHFDNKQILNGDLNFFICYAESSDGLNWVKPSLGICEFDGNADNNIILRAQDLPDADKGNFYDNFFCFKDENPNCLPEEKYKALAYYHEYKLSGYVSADGIHFHFLKVYDLEAHFDTLNTCYWDESISKYVAYVRGFHDIPPSGDLNEGIRDIRRTESTDFRKWTTAERIKFTNAYDYPLYTNNIMRYYRNTDLFVGFPVRYVERKEWTDNYDELCGRESRLERMKSHKRFGLATTDSIIMTSHDGKTFSRIEEALFTPGMENKFNWVYGDCYPVYLMFETKSDDGYSTELSMLIHNRYISNDEELPGELIRYTFRRDGFAYYTAPMSGGKIVFNKTICDGNEMIINFSTSAKGSVYVEIEDNDGNVLQSCETFGNSDERRVRFNGELKDYYGKIVRITVYLNDADFYSYKFI